MVSSTATAARFRTGVFNYIIHGRQLCASWNAKVAEQPLAGRGGCRLPSMSTLLPSSSSPPDFPGGGVFDDLPVDRKSCQLLGPTALVRTYSPARLFWHLTQQCFQIVQGLMGVFVIGSLLFKRHREKPKRPWRIWYVPRKTYTSGAHAFFRLFDVSKQVVGQMFVHGVNVFISDVGSTRSSGNACVFYFLNILIDTTLGASPCTYPSESLMLYTSGIGAIYLALHLLTWLFTDKLQFKGFQSGQYGSPPSLNYWARQAVVYVVSLTSMKLFVVLLLASWRRLLDIGAWLLSWLGNGDTAQVVLYVFILLSSVAS